MARNVAFKPIVPYKHLGPSKITTVEPKQPTTFFNDYPNMALLLNNFSGESGTVTFTCPVNQIWTFHQLNITMAGGTATGIIRINRSGFNVGVMWFPCVVAGAMANTNSATLIPAITIFPGDTVQFSVDAICTLAYCTAMYSIVPAQA